MKYSEALDYLYARLPMFTRVGAPALKYNLSNIEKLTAAAGYPHKHFPSVHIAGTNGKGSVAHLIAAVLQKAGFKTGLHTSPHYRDFRERMMINGEMMPEERVTEFIERHWDLIESLQPSFFEISVAMAFDHFAKEKVDFAVIETGLGGRFDSTNILLPVLSVITNISLEHQQFLGNTLAEIAGEKAGIIKKGVPAVIGTTHPETSPVFKNRAADCHAPIYFADKMLKTLRYEDNIDGITADFETFNGRAFHRLSTELAGTFQLENMRTALMSLLLLQEEFDIGDKDIYSGFYHVRKLTNMPGRWQIISKSPLIICDGAHNKAGLEAAVETLKRYAPAKLHIVFGCVKDKDVDEMLEILPKEARYYLCSPDIPRGLDIEALAAKAREHQMDFNAFDSCRMAYEAAKVVLNPDDVLYVGGSIFVVAEVILFSN